MRSAFSKAIAKATATADSVATKCTDRTRLLGGIFEPPNDPPCPGAAAQPVATDLGDARFDQE